MLEEVKENPLEGSSPPVKKTRSSCIGTVKKVYIFYKFNIGRRFLKLFNVCLLGVEERYFRADVVLENAGRR